MNPGLYGFPPGNTTKGASGLVFLGEFPTTAGSITLNLQGVLDTLQYEDFHIKLKGIQPDVQDVLQIRYFNSGVLDTTVSYSDFIQVESQSIIPPIYTANPLLSPQSGAGTQPLAGSFDFYNLGDPSLYKFFNCRATYQNAPNGMFTTLISGFYTGGAVDGIQLSFTAGSAFVAGGVARVYAYIKN